MAPCRAADAVRVSRGRRRPVGDDEGKLPAGGALDRRAGLYVEAGLVDADGEQPGQDLVVDAPPGLDGGGGVAEHDAQPEPVAVLDDLELADVGVRGEPGELERVHGHARSDKRSSLRPCTAARRVSVRPTGRARGRW